MTNHDSWNDCSWPTPLRWLLFLPAAVLASALVQFFLRWANPETPFIAELLATIAEPWPGLLIALWILPAFHRPFIIISTTIYLFVHILLISFVVNKPGFSVQPWADITLASVAIASGSVAAVYAWQRHFTSDAASPSPSLQRAPPSR